MKRLLIVYNPRSSHYAQVKRDILEKTHVLKGWMVGKYEIADTDVDDNAARLAKVVMDGDLLVAAGGDGTANIALNGALLSRRKSLRFATMGYGNFNDMSHMFGNLDFDEILRGDEQGEVQALWPLECKVNGRHWRYAMCYFTVGMFAEACAVFDAPKVRKKLQKSHKNKKKQHKKPQHLFGSLVALASWWFKNHKRRFLPCFSLGNSCDESIKCVANSDYMAINSPYVAKIMKGGNYGQNEHDFLSFVGQMTKFKKLIPMMFKSIFKRIPGLDSDYDCLCLAKPSSVMIQAEGEYKKFTGVEKIEIEKTVAPIYVIAKKQECKR